jgi:biopolymer transport protein ExbB/TolQ
MDGKAEFVTASGLTFVSIGIALLLMLILQIWIFVKVYETARMLVRVILQHQRAEKARREIQERDRIRIMKMIRRKASEDEWNKLILELGEANTEGEEL